MGRELREGEEFAGFRVRRRLGGGGMGAVYAVEHPRLPRLVALKLLTADASDAGALARFEREAETIARLDHPGIVDVLDRGVENGQPWISMQLIDGSDAGAVVRERGPMPWHRAARIGEQLAAALDAAHRRGVVHRDVKPANVMLTRGEHGQPERALLTDFGIARLEQSTTPAGRGDGATPPAADITGTLDGVRATAAFASPEQLSGHPTDGRSDQYSLACTLFALLTGRTPFPGTAHDAIRGHLNAPAPALDQVGVQLPPAASAALQRAMSKDPSARFDTCSDLAASFLAEGPSSAAPRRSKVVPAVLAAVLLVVSLLGVWWLVGQGRSSVTEASTTSRSITTSIDPEQALWTNAAPTLALWPQLLPHSVKSTGYQNMVCAPSEKQIPSRSVDFSYQMRCNARESGLDKPTILLDLLVFPKGSGQRAYEALGSPVGLPVFAHGDRLRVSNMSDPVEGTWILVRFTAADRADYQFQVGSMDGKLSYSQLYDWIGAAPF